MFQLGLLLHLVLAGAGNGPAEFVNIERLSPRVIVAYWVGVDRRCNLTAIQAQKGLTLERTMARLALWPNFPAFRDMPPGAWSHGMHERNIKNLRRILDQEETLPKAQQMRN